MSINGKRDGFDREDLIQMAKTADIKKVRAGQMVQNVIEVIRRWPDFAKKAGVSEEQVKKIKDSHRINL